MLVFLSAFSGSKLLVQLDIRTKYGENDQEETAPASYLLLFEIPGSDFLCSLTKVSVACGPKNIGEWVVTRT